MARLISQTGRWTVPGLLLLILGGWCATPLTSAEPEPFKVFAATGDQAQKEIDAVASRKDKATVYVFLAADQWARPVARYVKKLDEALNAGKGNSKDPEANADLRILVVWLSDDPIKGKEYLPKAQMSLQLTRTDWTVFDGPKAGPNGWNIDIASTLTTVLVRRGKEIGRFTYKSVNETDVDEALQALTKN
jgi:hypothetical protein